MRRAGTASRLRSARSRPRRPAARAGAVLMEPVRDRLFFAGEAVHETLWGTVGGAWESGERAAEAALKLWGRRRCAGLSYPPPLAGEVGA